MEPHIDKAQPDDAEGVLHLLGQHQLPLEGLRDHLGTTLVAHQKGQVVGSAALEVYAEGALLRSVAVAPQMQGKGLGHKLTEAAIRLAQDLQRRILTHADLHRDEALHQVKDEINGQG